MKVKEEVIKEVHRLVNTKLYQEYPCLDMANLEVHPEGSKKMWEVEWIVEAYEKALSDTKTVS